MSHVKVKGKAVIDGVGFTASADIQIIDEAGKIPASHITDALNYVVNQQGYTSKNFIWSTGDWSTFENTAPYPLRKGRKLVGTHGNYKNKEYTVVKANEDTDRYHIEFVRNLSKPYPTRRQGRKKSRPWQGSGIPAKGKDVLTEHQICNKFRVEPTKAEKILYDKPKI